MLWIALCFEFLPNLLFNLLEDELANVVQGFVVKYSQDVSTDLPRQLLSLRVFLIEDSVFAYKHYWGVWQPAY